MLADKLREPRGKDSHLLLTDLPWGCHKIVLQSTGWGWGGLGCPTV